MMSRHSLVLVLMTIAGLSPLKGQDTMSLIPDSVAATSNFDYYERFNPRRALFYAAVLPGMGQVYTKKYWKLPIVYGGIGAGIYVMNFYQKNYSQYRSELLENLSANTFPSQPSKLSEATLRRVVDFYRRKRDFTIVLLGIGYLLQMVDAHVDAHLKEFRYNPNLKVGLRPEVSQDLMTGRTAGASLTITF
ncbi:MAG: DUF5683 domain-containing protein [Bacteroidota bacterium]